MPMKTKLVWPATLLASFALAAACGGGTTDGDGEGGQGGTDGSTGGSGTGGTGTGGSSQGGQGGLGGGATIVQPETCGDELLNANETDVDCGGPDCNPCGPGDECVAAADCASGICDEVADTCTAPECGDGVTNDDEECDPGRETETCNVDCTFTECGDGYLNEAAEQCEPDADLDIWQRCGPTCVYGVDLDGTWRTSNLPGTNSPWEPLAGNTVYTNDYYGSSMGLQSFSYAGQDFLYDFSTPARYNIVDNIWDPLADPLPFAVGGIWPIGAVDADAIWIARDASIFRFDLGDETWDTPITEVPDGTSQNTSTTFDGAGFLWYAYYDATIYDPVKMVDGLPLLVRVDPDSGSFETFSWSADALNFEFLYPRVVYDPVTNKILVSSYTATTILLFDLDTETFSESEPAPDGLAVSGVACGDRAGGYYFGTVNLLISEPSALMRYDVLADTFADVPSPPFALDYIAPCVVSDVGYLYVGATNSGYDPPNFARLRLNQR